MVGTRIMPMLSLPGGRLMGLLLGYAFLLVSRIWRVLLTSVRLRTSSAPGHDPMLLRWVPVVLKLKGVSALLVELYLITGIGVVGQNLEILQQILVLKNLLHMPVIVAAVWQCTPDLLAETGWLDRGGMTLAVPDIDSTCNVDGRIDYLSISPCMLPLMISINADLEVPWGPHCAIRLHLMARLRAVRCRKLVVPKPLPLEELIAAGGGVHDSELWASSLAWADKRAQRGIGSWYPRSFACLVSWFLFACLCC